MMKTARSLRLYALLALTALVTSFVAGCGGGGGGGGPSSVQLGGLVATPAIGSLTGTPVNGATVKAYIWPATTTSVAQATTASNGRYSLSLPTSNAGKDIVLVAEKPLANNQTLRLSTIVPSVPSAGVSAADLDFASTFASEAVAAQGLSTSAPGISPSAFETIAAEMRTHTTATTDDLLIGGSTLPAAFGQGLKAESSADDFAKTDPVVKAALTNVTASTDANVKAAKHIVQTVRDIAGGLVSPSSVGIMGLQDALTAEQEAIVKGVQIPAEFVQRLNFVALVLGYRSVPGGSDASLVDKASGVYELRQSTTTPLVLTLVKTGNSTDGKSWTVTSTVPDNSLGLTLTVTPKTQVATYSVLPEGGGYTMSVRNSADPTLKYDGAINIATSTTGGNISLNISLTDAKLTAPIVFNGAANIQMGSSTTAAQFSLNGTFTSQYASASVGSLVVLTQPGTSSQLQKITLTDLQASTPIGQTTTLKVPSVVVDFVAPDPGAGFDSATPSRITFGGSFEGSGYSLAVTGGDITIARFLQNGKPAYAPSAIKGSATYTAPTTSFTGSLDAKWNNPFAGTFSTTMPVASFPTGTVHFIGSLTPKVGLPLQGDLTLVSDTSGANPAVTLSIVKAATPNENITGTVTAPLAVANGQVTPTGTVTANLKGEQSGLSMQLTASKTVVNGTIMNGTTKVADIGRAKDLGLPDLGNIVIIKYTDGTFETAASLLPFPIP